MLPVVDDNLELVGIVSEGDLVSDRFPLDVRFDTSTETINAPGPTVADVMTKDVVTAAVSDSARALISRMRATGVRAVPVCQERTVVVVTYRDLVRMLARADERIAADVRRRLESCFRPGQFTATVHDGEVTLTDRMARPAEWHTARVLVEQVPGVVRARVIGEPEAPHKESPH